MEPWELKSLLEEHPKIRGITVETRVSSISRDGDKTVAKVRVGRVEAAAEALAMNGTRVVEDAVVDYLYVDASSHNPFRRVKPAAYAGGGVDLGKYVDLVREAAESVLAPFEGPG